MLIKTTRMTKRVVVYGGKGGLGTVIVQHFKSLGHWVCSIDIAANAEADHNVLVDLKADWVGQEGGVVAGVEAAIANNKLDAVINMAGGWAGGCAKDADWVRNADMMWKQSVWSSAISATLAAKFLVKGGLLVLPGARPAEGATPGMMGYGMAKAAVHQLVKSLGASGSGLPEGATTCALLPVTLDTPMNRKFMPDADHSTWTPLEEVARLMEEWCEGRGRPVAGSLVALITKGGVTSQVID